MCRKQTIKNDTNGFTLIEIIASIAILGIVLAVMLPIFPQIISWTNKTDDQLVASNLLGQVVHQLEETMIEVDEYLSCSDRVTNTIHEVDNELTNVSMIEQSDDENTLGLYRIHIEILSEKEENNKLSDTYMYLACEGDPIE